MGLCTCVKSYLRCYPEGFARQLLTIYEGRKSFPEHLRSKAHIDLTLSDRALFEQMQVGDLWLDGRLPAVWAYIYRSKHVTIPPSWENAMKEFDLAVTQLVPHLYSYCIYVIIYCIYIYIYKVKSQKQYNYQEYIKDDVHTYLMVMNSRYIYIYL